MTLFRQHFRAQRNGLFIWLAASVVTTLAVASVANSMQQSDILGKLGETAPAALQALLGLLPGMSPVDGYIQAKLGVGMALILPIYACLLAMSAITREVDRGTADFLLALPVDRRRLLLARWGVMAANLGILTLGVWLALVAGLAASHVTGSLGGYFWMLAQAWLLALAFGSLALLLSIWIDDYSLGVKVTLAGTGTLYVIDLGMRIAGLSKLVRGFNPFTYVDAARTVMANHLLWGDAAVLAAVAALGLWLAARAFDRKQIHS